MTYRYDKDLSTSKWTIMIDTVDNYGYFERNSDGTGGGLWFDPCGPNGRTELIDYDGVPYLAQEIVTALRSDCYYLDQTFDPDPAPVKVSLERRRV